MRFIDTSGLESLGPAGMGPWRMGKDRIVRIANGGHPLRTEEEAQAMLEVYRATAATGIGAPTGYEVVRLADGYAVVVGYVAGLNLGTHLALGTFTAYEVGQRMGSLARELHGKSVSVGQDWNAAFRGWAHLLGRLLPRTTTGRLEQLVDAVPARQSLLHGDLHMGNVVVLDGRLSLIDLEVAGFGHPVFDLAVTHSHIINDAELKADSFGIDAKRARHGAHRMWAGFLDAYFDDRGMSEAHEVWHRVESLSAVVYCCLYHGVASTDSDRLSERQQEALATCAERLDDLLPRIDRLDF